MEDHQLHPSAFRSYNPSREIIENYISLSIYQELNANFPGQSPYSGSLASVFNCTGTPQNAGILKLNDLSVLPFPNGGYSFYFFDTTNFGRSYASTLPGKILTVGISGSANIKSFTTQIHLPKRFIADNQINTQYKGGDMVLNWTPDTTKYNMVGISLILQGSESIKLSNQVYFDAPDNGIFTIPAIAFSQWPKGSQINLELSRTDETRYVDPVDQKVTWIFGNTAAHAFLYVVE